jgi:hypothetical protein
LVLCRGWLVLARLWWRFWEGQDDPWPGWLIQLDCVHQWTFAERGQATVCGFIDRPDEAFHLAALLQGYYCCSAAKTVWLMAAAFAGTAVAVDGSSC